MINFVTFLHTIGAVGMGLYLLLPFLVGRVTQLTGEGQAGLADGLVFANRIAQYCLILQLLTGGYMMSNADYTVLWMVLITVLFLAIAALGGIAAKPLKRIAAAIQSGQSASAHIARVRMFSIIILILYLAIIYLMQYPDYRA
jgi:hypothetical protein